MSRGERDSLSQRITDGRVTSNDAKRMGRKGIALGTVLEAVAGVTIATSKPVYAIIPGVLGLINYGLAKVNYGTYRKLKSIES